MPRDAPERAPATTLRDAVEEGERAYHCARCGLLVTRGRWERTMDGAHERAFFNPAGLVFRVLCFKEAPGAVAVGPASAEFTWFKGYAWRVAVCRACAAHLGWQYEGTGEPRVFFGLIKTALTMK